MAPWRQPPRPENGSLYGSALTAFQKLERAECLFFLGKAGEGLELLDSAEENLKRLETWDYEVLRQFYRLVQSCYVRASRMGKMLGAMLDVSRIV
ncbi:MAG TPA: hypothetical protein VF756_02460 [Thermoanaerobaculia bacterium]